jgi:hypothetical protein
MLSRRRRQSRARTRVKGRYLAYKAGSRKFDVDKLNAAGTGIVAVWSSWRTPGWA